MISKKSLFSLATTLGGMPVLSTLPGSPAARAGVRYGDIVLSVNGRPTSTVGDYVQASALRSDGMTLVLFRNGVEEQLELIYDRERRSLEDALTQLAELRAISEDPPEPEGSED